MENSFPIANILICERILLEKDDVLTPVRLVDLFLVDETSDTAQMSLLAMIKFPPGHTQTHLLEFLVIGPDGRRQQLGGDNPVDFSALTTKVEGTYKGFTLAGQVRVDAVPGNHAAHLLLDGQPVATAVFAVAKQPSK